MGQNEMVAEYTESAHPYKQPAEVLHIAAETKNRTGYVLFPKVTKFSTWLLSRYGKRIDTELAEGIMAGEYAAAMRLYDAATAHVSCRFNLGYVCSDEEYNRHYIDFVTGGKDMTEEEVNERASQIVMKMPQKPGEALKYLVEEAGKARRKKISAQELSERCGVSKRTVYYWLEEEYQLSAEVFVRIVVGLHLPPYISMRFMNVCGVMLQFYGVHMMYWKILNCFFMDTIYEVNRHMRDAGFPTMTEGIE